MPIIESIYLPVSRKNHYCKLSQSVCISPNDTLHVLGACTERHSYIKHIQLVAPALLQPAISKRPGFDSAALFRICASDSPV